MIVFYILLRLVVPLPTYVDYGKYIPLRQQYFSLFVKKYKSREYVISA